MAPAADRNAETELWMGRVKSLPRGFDAWAYRTVFANRRYIFLEIKDGKRTGTCKHCGHVWEMTAKVGTSTKCAKCGTKSIAKSAKRYGNLQHTAVVSVVQRIRGGVVVRTVRVSLSYWVTPARPDHYELRRTVWPDDAKTPTKYAVPYTGIGWARNPYVADDYPNALHPCARAALRGTRWQYSGLPEAGARWRFPVEHYLRAYTRFPCLEMVSKLGFRALALSIIDCGRRANQPSSETRTRLRSKDPETVVGITKRYWPIVRELDLDVQQIQTLDSIVRMGGDPTLEDAKLIMDVGFWGSGSWAVGLWKHHRDILRWRPTMDYLQTQEREEYDDYLTMARTLRINLKDPDILRPKVLEEAHDRLSAQMDMVKALKHTEAVRKAAEMNRALEISRGGMLTRLPSDAAEIVREGQALHHCVGTYAERVAKGECLIVFVRQVEAPDEPYVTVELKDGKVAQARGKNNAQPPKEVERFLAEWIPKRPKGNAKLMHAAAQ